MMEIITFSIVGFFISLYVFYVEKQIQRDAKYKPVCDISDRISCSKPILSSYGNMLGISNALAGMIFYLGMVFLAWFHFDGLVLLGAAMSTLASLFFAYILYFKIRSVCLMCTTLYLINVLLLVFSYKNI